VGDEAKAAAPKKGYVGIHATGFKDFLLKPEILRAIVDCGFEHPSEGESQPRRAPRLISSVSLGLTPSPGTLARFPHALRRPAAPPLLATAC